MPSPSDTGTPRCILCSMSCPIGARKDSMGFTATVFPNDLGIEQGACVRGLAAARLLDVPERIFEAAVAGETATVEAVLGKLIDAVSGDAQKVGVVVDLNRPLEGILTAAALCRQSGARFAVFAPPEDAAFVKAGLSGGPPLAEIRDCDVLLAIGDPFSSHPAIAAAVRDVQFGGRGNQLIAVDSVAGRTCREANQAVTVGPLKLAGFVVALAAECGARVVSEALGGKNAQEICAALGVPAEQVRSVAGALKGAKSPGVILSHSVGRYADGAAVVAAVKEMAGAIGAKVWPLPVSTNSALLPALKKSFGAAELGDILKAAESGELDALLVVGFDPADVLPERLWGQMRKGCKLLCWAGSIRGSFAEVADCVIPLALPWEEEGTVLDPTGKPSEFVPWLSKPDSALSVAGLFERLAAAAGIGAPEFAVRRIGVDELLAGPIQDPAPAGLVTPALLEAIEPGPGQAVVVGSPEPQGYTGGIPLEAAGWQRRIAAEETATVSVELARELELGGDGLIELSNGLTTAVVCRPGVEKEGRMVAVPSHWPALREMLQWRGPDGAIEPAPALVQIKKCD